MRLFECDKCQNLIYFENVHCERCGSRIGFRDDQMRLTAIEPISGEKQGWAQLWRSVRDPEDHFKLCANTIYDACNWLIPAEKSDDYCTACRFNRTVPDLGDPASVLLWEKVEAAKHRLIYGLLRLRLPIISKFDNPAIGLAFDFLADPNIADYVTEHSSVILTGHARGVITINIAEADDVVREERRRQFSEPYRTLLGHFRHEIGHYYWERLIRDGQRIDPFRRLFGDERANYQKALEAHYNQYTKPDWEESYVSAYAAAHPWEDWAECWAHYMHMVDTLETAHHFGMRVSPRTTTIAKTMTTADFDPYGEPDFQAIIGTWLPLTHAVNSLNRSMGQPDLYPFVLSQKVIEKLGFIHDLLNSLDDADRFDSTAFGRMGTQMAAPGTGL
ncbi:MULTISPECIES: putative zinc-binding peptidase [unclassified Iodidimonas]|jgi:hypothetical protein|uniref:zinc-binding metallopeptidase family protein n=1 Tax=unclassified Iodidimonas TaxID=2626145 RepID=UPI002482AA68|nr:MULTISPECIES: putative zinc-binding peptidase [unclassified Iodidimonas]